MKKRIHLLIITLLVINSTYSQNHFVSTWSTATPGAPVIIPTIGSGYNYDVDWENDGNFDDLGVTGNITHNYPNAGTHTIAIRGDFPRIYFNGGGSNNQLLSIEQWGDIAWTSFHRAFSGCSNLVINASDAPDLSGVTDLSLMFWRCSSLNQSINHWDVSNITSMTGMFSETPFNQPLNNWNVSNVTSMGNMFNQATSFNQPLNSWDVSNVTIMSNMFRATPFNQPLNNWNVSSVTQMDSMFAYNSVFNQSLNSWTVNNVTNMSSMFEASQAFNQPLNNWDVSNVTNMSIMFTGAQAFNQPLNSWNTINVTNMAYMFFSANSFNRRLGAWNVGSVTNMSSMFENANSFNQPLLNWNVSNITNMSNMFRMASSFNQPLNNWNVGSVIDMSNMFDGASSFDQSIASWNVSNVTNMTNMFLNVTLSITNYDALLIAWEAQSLISNVSFHGGSSQYCNASNERTNIINNYGWTITDGGQATCQLSVEENEIQNISFYPNPTKNNFIIKTHQKINQVSIYNIQGKKIKSFKERQDNYNIEELTTGIYFIKIETDKGITTRKLIKQ